MSGYHKRNWETFPMHKLNRVDRPTTTDQRRENAESEGAGKRLS